MQHNANYVVFLRLNHQAESFNFSAMLRSGAHDIDPCRFNTAVPQNIRQLCDVLFQTVESSDKELTQIMGKYLRRTYARLPTQVLHFSPNTTAVHRAAVS